MEDSEAPTMYADRGYGDPWITQNVDLVKRIAYRLISRLPESVQVEDLIQAGMLGLLEARERYRQDQGASFATFAGIRIRGAMLDEIRRGDWTPRSVHRASRAVAEAQARVEGRCNRPASESEIAAELGLSLEHYRRTVSDAAYAQLTSLDEPGNDMLPHEVADESEVNRPSAAVERQSLFEAVIAASENLPERERLLIVWYYDQELNLREIAERLGVSESRACQLHGRAISRVRAQLDDWAA